jgi:hypothetical protein
LAEFNEFKKLQNIEIAGENGEEEDSSENESLAVNESENRNYKLSILQFIVLMNLTATQILKNAFDSNTESAYDNFFVFCPEITNQEKNNKQVPIPIWKNFSVEFLKNLSKKKHFKIYAFIGNEFKNKQYENCIYSSKNFSFFFPANQKQTDNSAKNIIYQKIIKIQAIQIMLSVLENIANEKTLF